MRTPSLRVVLAFCLLALTVAGKQAFATCDPDGQQASGAVYRLCMPEPGQWNGNLVVFAHGYVAFNEPVGIPESQLMLDDGTYVPDLVTDLGYAFAITSYSVNGLAVTQGLADVLDLVSIFTTTYGAPQHTYLTGASEGGLITTQAIEQYPDMFDGALAMCGPIGDFPRQIDYWGDFRVVFDYFFPGVIPGSAVDIPAAVIDDWYTVYEPAALQAIHANPDATEQLLRVTHAAFDRKDLASVDETVSGLLWYNVFATNDGVDKLGGQPFDNQNKVYRGSDNDELLNTMVARFSADSAALSEMEGNYQTEGRLRNPLVTLHTTADPIVPYQHEPAYQKKLSTTSILQHINIPARHYGHCAFDSVEVLGAFAVLVGLVEGIPLQVAGDTP